MESNRRVPRTEREGTRENEDDLPVGREKSSGTRGNRERWTFNRARGAADDSGTEQKEHGATTGQPSLSLAPPTWGYGHGRDIRGFEQRWPDERGTWWKGRIRARWTIDTCWMTGDFGTE